MKKRTISDSLAPYAKQSRSGAAIRLVSHDNSFARLDNWARSARAYFEPLKYPVPARESFKDPRFEEQRFNGDSVLSSCRHDLTRFLPGFKPTEVQMKMHEMSFMCEGPVFYRREWYLHRRLILLKNNWKRMLSILLILTPRKFGKTYFLGQHLTVHLMNFPHHEIACISKTLRQSILIVQILKKVFKMHERSNEFTFVINRATKLIVAPKGNLKDERIVDAYPGNANVSQKNTYSFYYYYAVTTTTATVD